MYRKIILVGAVLSILTAIALLPAQAVDVFNYGGHSYFLTEELLWPDAEAAAQAAGGHLVTVNDAAEQQWLTDTFTGNSYWIGLYQLPDSVEPDQGFVWVSGEPVTYTNWVGTEPNDYSTETYVAMNEHYPGGWNDLPEDWQLRGIAEVPEPCSMVAVVLGLGLLLRKRQKTT